jgi:signal transduction histidine kinase
MLVNDLLDLGKLSRVGWKWILGGECGSLLEKAIALFSRQAEEKGVKLTSALPENLPEVRADANTNHLGTN